MSQLFGAVYMDILIFLFEIKIYRSLIIVPRKDFSSHSLPLLATLILIVSLVLNIAFIYLFSICPHNLKQFLLILSSIRATSNCWHMRTFFSLSFLITLYVYFNSLISTTWILYKRILERNIRDQKHMDQASKKEY